MEQILGNVLKPVVKEIKIQKSTLNNSYLVSNYVKYISY